MGCIVGVSVHVWSMSGHPDFTLVLAGVPLDFTPLASIGGAGVTIFFVLSGFLLAIPFAEWQSGLRQRPALDRYFLRRVMRGSPAYYVQLVILLLIAAWVPGQPGIDDWGSLFRHLFMLFMPPPLGVEPINLFMMYAGLVSYSYYLWHFPVLNWIVATEWFQALESMRFLTLLLVSAPLIFVISTLSYVLVEVPGMRFRRGRNHVRPR
jgi:peptidoglycan/LPS O-acetylase OafA/YrhL